MPTEKIEVFPIDGPRTIPNNALANIANRGGVEKTADDIKDVYTKVMKDGGRIIAGHTLDVLAITANRSGHPESEVTRTVLFLVAEYPEETL